MPTQDVDATLLVEQPDTTLLALKANASRHLLTSDPTTLAKLDSILIELEEKLAAGGTVALDGPTITSLLAIRALALATDSVRQTARPMKPRHFSITAGGADNVLTPTAGQRLRILRVDGGCKPSTADGVYPSYALTLDVGAGVETIRGKELQAGEPIGCTVCWEGVTNAPLTTSVTGPGGTVEFDIYYEEFT